MDNDDDLIVMDHNSSDAQRFRVDVNEGRVYTDDNGYHGRSMASDAAFKSGVHSVTAYGRNSSTHDATKWSAYVQMNGDYRGHGNEATNEDTAMFYARSSGTLRTRGSRCTTLTCRVGPGITAHSMDAGPIKHDRLGRGLLQDRRACAGLRRQLRQLYLHPRPERSRHQLRLSGGRRHTSNRVQADGNGYFDGGADQGNADYAEMFEWADGNPDAEDRRGYPVCLDGEMVRFATSDDAPEDIIGIVSAEPGSLGRLSHSELAGAAP